MNLNHIEPWGLQINIVQERILHDNPFTWALLRSMFEVCTMWEDKPNSCNLI